MDTWRRMLCFCSVIWIHLLAGAWSANNDVVGVVAGGEATLPCIVDIAGQVDVSWFDPSGHQLTRNQDVVTSDDRFSLDHPYYDEWNLVIEGVKDQDEGQYTCRVYTNPREDNLVDLIIHYPPTIDYNSGDVSPVTGDDVTLQCLASGVPEPTITWYKYTYSGDMDDLGHEGSTYTMTNVSRHDAGTYECSAGNNVPPVATEQMKVDVRFAPYIDLPYENVNQPLGKDTLLQCMITTNPHDVMYWEKDGVRLEESSKYELMVWEIAEHTKNLAIKVVGLELVDFGDYTCVARNDLGEERATMHLYETHTGNLRVLAKPKDVISQRKEDVLFNCTVEGITQTDCLTWWHNHPVSGLNRIFVSNPSQQDVPLLDESKYEIKGHYDLLVRGVADGDYGEYLCDITNHDNYTADLTLVDIPECIVNSTEVNEGDPAELTCMLQFAGPDPIWQVEWQHGTRKLSSVNLDEDGLLVRQVQFRAQVEDAGVYVCRITSNEPDYFGSCSVEIDVIKIEPSPAPVCEAAAVGALSLPAFWVVLGLSFFVMLILFAAVLAGVVGYYRKKLNLQKEELSYSEAESSPPKTYKNGGFVDADEVQPADSKARGLTSGALQKWENQFRGGGTDSRTRGGRGVTDVSSEPSGLYEEIYCATLTDYGDQEGIIV